MLEKYLSRRELINYGKLSLLFLLNSCSNSSEKLKISLQSSLYPKFFKETFPAGWKQENTNFANYKLEKDKTRLLNSDVTLINDGWINGINLGNFQNLDFLFLNDNLDKRSKDFLKTFEDHERKKIFPIGIVPYAVILKNNNDLIDAAYKSWDFLLYKKLKGKIIFPESSRIIISISKKINEINSLSKLKGQAMLYDDQNALNWLINSDAAVAIVPYTFCIKYFRYDSRLSIVFPNQGVPLMWFFLLSKSKDNSKKLINWINFLENSEVIDKLANQGWYLPFENVNSQSKYKKNIRKNNFGPSKICWENSWSLPPLNNAQKLNLENLWNQSLIP